ncbi:MAG: hypothetical protein KME60_31680 [Cyanomargarita calcarea GSE-NOS-MK-12-04C]|jgi:hypothetical protein|uniref:Uncharacterized protein n=1 Tax=Cyanomargarita calcarea GSE-NOS-MK-12-04C TaxID=2839659 RepID=A0A951V0N7_9CYAN|nr:hypothetical protein [Cyanomargarita calcarea GSE-NOS-MK-12-04C]
MKEEGRRKKEFVGLQDVDSDKAALRSIRLRAQTCLTTKNGQHERGRGIKKDSEDNLSMIKTLKLWIANC